MADPLVKLYNTAPCARSPLGRKLSPEARAKISASNSRRRLSQETKDQISRALRGIKQPPEVTAAIIKTRAAQKFSIGWEARLDQKSRKCKANALKMWRTRIKPIPFELKFQNGKLFRGKNLHEFAKRRGLDVATLKGVVSGKREQHKGYHLATRPIPEYNLRSPNGSLVKSFNLSALCRDNGLDSKSMWGVIRGAYQQHKQWRKVV